MWEEDGQNWRRLYVDYPADIATHSPQQVLYVDDDGLIRRRDYHVDIAGRSPAAHCVSEFQNIDGIIIPAKRMIYVRDDAGHPSPISWSSPSSLTDIRVS